MHLIFIECETLVRCYENIVWEQYELKTDVSKLSNTTADSEWEMPLC